MFISHYSETSILSLVIFKEGAVKICHTYKVAVLKGNVRSFLRDLFEKEIV